jgi:hypothetical protein
MSILLIAPRFGTRPPYLPLVLNSMAPNPGIHRLLITDGPGGGAPPNVAVRLCAFEDLVARIQRCFAFPIALEHPYRQVDRTSGFSSIATR